MTPDEARAELAVPRRRQGRPPGNGMSFEQRRARQSARAQAQAKRDADGALARLHKADYDALYAVALADEFAKIGQM